MTDTARTEIPPERRYRVDLPSLHEHFPPALPVPALLVEFAEWAENKPFRSIGDFDVEGSRLSDAWAEEFGDLYPHFAPFLHIGEGSLVGFWKPEEMAADSLPVVYIGSEGELQLLADSLEQFLSHLAAGTTQVGLLDPPWPKDDSELRQLPDSIKELMVRMADRPGLQSEPGDQRESLARWLSSCGIPRPKRARTLPELNEWFESRTTEKEALRNRDPVRIEIAEKLRRFAHPPHDAKRYWTANFDVLLVGRRFNIGHRYYGQIPLPSELAAELEPLFRADRDRRARCRPERGLWFQSLVTVSLNGGARLRCEFYDEPRIADSRPEIAVEDFAADLRAFPRSQYWMPMWLRKKLGM